MDKEAPNGVTRTPLYGGSVTLDFNPTSKKYRYVVTDNQHGLRGQSVRGVTSVLKGILDKPGLMTWPMNMSHKYLFGATWNEDTSKYLYVKKAAALQPDASYSETALQQLLEDAGKQYTKRADRGKDIGTMVHQAIELYLNDAENPVEATVGDFAPTEPSVADYNDKEAHKAAMAVYEDEEKDYKEHVSAVKKAFKAFTDWWESLNDKRVLHLEKPVYSRNMQYAGTLDMIVTIDGKTYLMDIKTTNRSKEAPLGVYPEYFLQLGAYSYAYKEETGLEFDDLGIINVGKDGKLSIATAADIGLSVDECERAFAFGVRLHDWLEKIAPLTKDGGFRSSLLTGADGR